jgi:hypothetical protein
MSATEFGSVHIAFENEDVTVSSNDLELLATIRTIFGPAVIPEARRSIGLVKVIHGSHGFTIETAEGSEDIIDTLATLPAHLKHVVHGFFVRSRRDLLWLHAAAVAKDGKAILVLGESGQGKSTISTKLVDHGWRLLSDDNAPVSGITVLPYFQMPVRRLPVIGALTPAELRDAPRETVQLPVGSICRTGMPVVRNIFVKFKGSGIGEVVPIRPAEAGLALLKHSVSFHKGHDATLEKVSTLAQRVSSYELIYGDSDRAVEAIADF